ncbi:hypothetical protein B0181_08705 [Moraxella caviae]|uniref:DNA replication and repair protein RecF n=1 Tax=Moraxella caviae TaxID=34060 RepID=A0A1S9ZXM1_9GAMM|nr:DNA replication and repair protein RecF [Moraxella caviae]OOR88158.1 hypothetical protein B0181_08705 [Moraxella caviae]STZ10513.1 DNA replication and repair protein recF [Moraxella caviae]VEW13204.1 DNA replication and repair protein recF [Moraxella caviae]VEW14270.1 DNA replication and repair protein recF [Moraxella caviae]
MLSTLRVHQLRNIAQADLALSQYNLITGANGSGKTSLLEAVFLLSRGKTFRHHEPKRYITHHTNACTVWAKTQDGTALAIQKQLDAANLATTILRLNDTPLTAQSELAKRLPVLLIDPAGMTVLEEGSGARRQLLDWLAFHVKPTFHNEWLAYQRLLKQRNALLKSARCARELAAWDQQLSQHAARLHEARQAVFAAWHPLFLAMVAQLLPAYADRIKLSYSAGFDVSAGLFAVLQSRIDGDVELGYTRVGAHRADVSVTMGGTAQQREQASNVLSRGEKKLLITALKLSQLQLICQYRTSQAAAFDGALPMVLIDDIDAELDERAVEVFLDVALALPCQLFISSLQAGIAKTIIAKLKVKHAQGTSFQNQPSQEQISQNPPSQDSTAQDAPPLSQSFDGQAQDLLKVFTVHQGAVSAVQMMNDE